MGIVGGIRVPGPGQSCVGQRRVDEWVVPGKMSRRPVADHGCEFSGLKSDAWMIERRVAQEIFIEPHLGTLIGRIETAIHSKLSEKVPVACPLGVEKKRDPRIEEKTIVRLDEPRRALIDEV